MTAPERVWAVIAGGGTAGHVVCGLGIAEEIAARGAPSAAVHWVGSARGIETRLVPEAGYALTALGGRGLQRRLTPANAAAAAGLAGAFARSWRLLGRLRPAVVVGLGGYASTACGAAAALRRIPLVVVEQNAVAGAANRLLGRFASGAAGAFDNVDLPGARWTGNPVRSEVLAVDRASGRAAARAALGVECDRRLVAVFGGSLGALRINEAVAEAASSDAEWGWRRRADLHVRHIAGRRDHAEMAERTLGLRGGGAEAAGSGGRLCYDLVPYEDDMAAVYAAADVVVCRAGATTVSELAAVGVASVLVPLPGAPRDHQTANARALVDAGAAVMVADSQLDGPRFASEVDALLADPGRLLEMGRAGLALSRPGAAAAVVDLVEECARRPRPPAAP